LLELKSLAGPVHRLGNLRTRTPPVITGVFYKAADIPSRA